MDETDERLRSTDYWDSNDNYPMNEWQDAVAQLRSEHRHILQAADIGFDSLNTQLRVLMSQADEQYEELLIWLSDPAKDGPRLFSFEPANRSVFDPLGWARARFRLTLWCEHTKLPLPYPIFLLKSIYIFRLQYL